MSKLIIANATRQNHVYNIRVPEHKLLRLDVPSGQQRTFPLSLNADQQDFVLRQLERFGAVPRSKVHGKVENFISGCVFSLDKPLTEDEFKMANEDQLDAAQDRSVKQAVRLVKAADLSHREDNSVRGKRALKSLEVSVSAKTDKRGGEVPMMGVEIIEGGQDRLPA